MSLYLGPFGTGYSCCIIIIMIIFSIFRQVRTEFKCKTNSLMLDAYYMCTHDMWCMYCYCTGTHTRYMCCYKIFVLFNLKYYIIYFIFLYKYKYKIVLNKKNNNNNNKKIYYTMMYTPHRTWYHYHEKYVVYFIVLLLLSLYNSLFKIDAFRTKTNREHHPPSVLPGSATQTVISRKKVDHACQKCLLHQYLENHDVYSVSCMEQTDQCFLCP